MFPLNKKLFVVCGVAFLFILIAYICSSWTQVVWDCDIIWIGVLESFILFRTRQTSLRMQPLWFFLGFDYCFAQDLYFVVRFYWLRCSCFLLIVLQSWACTPWNNEFATVWFFFTRYWLTAVFLNCFYWVSVLMYN